MIMKWRIDGMSLSDKSQMIIMNRNSMRMSLKTVIMKGNLVCRQRKLMDINEMKEERGKTSLLESF